MGRIPVGTLIRSSQACTSTSGTYWVTAAKLLGNTMRKRLAGGSCSDSLAVIVALLTKCNLCDGIEIYFLKHGPGQPSWCKGVAGQVAYGIDCPKQKKRKKEE